MSCSILVYFLGNKALLSTKYDGEMSFVGVLSAVGLWLDERGSQGAETRRAKTSVAIHAKICSAFRGNFRGLPEV